MPLKLKTASCAIWLPNLSVIPPPFLSLPVRAYETSLPRCQAGDTHSLSMKRRSRPPLPPAPSPSSVSLITVGHDADPYSPGPEHSVTYQNGRYVDRVVNFPLPTDDPADPLNWPQWRKAGCMVTVSFYAFVSNYISASLAPALPAWNKEFPHDRQPTEDLMQLVAVRP